MCSSSAECWPTVLEAVDRAAGSLDQKSNLSPEVRNELRATMAAVYLNLDEGQACLKLLGSAAAERDAQHAPPLKRSKLAIFRSECHLPLDQREPAARWLEIAAAALVGQSGPEADALRAFVLVDQGQLKSLDGKLTDANALFRDALKIAEPGGHTEQIYRAHRLLGANLQVANDHAAALEHLKRAYDLTVDLNGPSHRSTLTMAGSLALTLGRLARFDDASRLLESALVAARSIEHRGGQVDIVLARLHDDNATLHWQRGDLAGCLHQANASIAHYLPNIEPNSSQPFNPTWRAATCAYQRKEWAQARQFGERALSYARLGVPVGVINAHRLLAAADAREGKLDQARAHLRAADAAVATTEIANPTVRSALTLSKALVAQRAGDLDAARAHLAAADALIEESGLNPAWLQQERADIAALLTPQ
jgi:tetratricopeptide (TPR) repeat protein